jgi:hypothetical protein
MTITASFRRLAVLVAGGALLAACAGYGGSQLQPGVATLPDVMAAMGQPSMSWTNTDGSQQLAYPRGPEGTQTFMVFLGADGRVQRIEGVLDRAHFALVEPGKSDRAAVLRLLGPAQPQWEAYFAARDELVWEWSFCDGWNHLARFDVLFDASSGIVRTSYHRPYLQGPDGVELTCGR